MEENAASRSLLNYIILTALICGALVMVLEVLGSRVIGPFFGVSLFVWTSLITVTLVALSAGYAAGGFLSDKKKSPDYLYGIILAAGVLVALIPLMKGPVLKTCQPLGLRVGAFLSASVLFGPALFLLGCVSPYIIKIAASEVRNIGRTVGAFYAISTFGSFLGTVLTGFVLIAYFRVSSIFLSIGFLLIALSAVYFAFFRKRRVVLALLFLPLLFSPGETAVSRVMPNGTRVSEVHSRDGFYGKLKVIDYSYGERHTRELMIDGLVQGGVDMGSGLSVYEYSYLLEFLPYSLNPSGQRCLVIGLGAGIVPMWYERAGKKVDVVDINPDVFDIAQKYFGFHISGETFVEDARYFVLTTNNIYDYVILDVFTGDTTPAHLLNQEALREIRSKLAPSGVLAVNLIGSIGTDSFMTASVVKTLGTVFENVVINPIFSPEEGDGFGNLIVIAYNGPRVAFNPEVTRAFDVHSMAADGVSRFLGTRFEFPADSPAIVLSDDYNPIDFFDLRVKERVRKDIIDVVHWDILL